MAFRADESIKDGSERAIRYLVPRDLVGAKKQHVQYIVEDIIDECGPVIDGYPSWHPLVSANKERHCPITRPRRECGYEGLDHTVYFTNGFVTCPYNDGQKVINSVENLPLNPIATIVAKRLDGTLYNDRTTAIFVRCIWNKSLDVGGMIPKSLAVPLMLEQEVPCWRWAERGETWESMRPYILGTPFGSRSSLFVNQETGQTLKKIWNDLIYTGMFGPIKV